jgi:hypothetical protein
MLSPTESHLVVRFLRIFARHVPDVYINNPSCQFHSCKDTKWEVNLYTITVAFFAQIMIAVR